MTMEELKSKLKRKRKKKLKEERDAVMAYEESLRVKETAVLQEIVALQSELESLTEEDDREAKKQTIQSKKEELELIMKLRQETKDVLKVYSEILKDDREGRAASRNSIFSGIFSIGSLTVGAIGLGAAFQSDNEGTLINRHTFDWLKNLPVFKKKV